MGFFEFGFSRIGAVLSFAEHVAENEDGCFGDVKRVNGLYRYSSEFVRLATMDGAK